MATVRTYDDLIQNVLDGFGELVRDDRNMRLCRLAVQNAYRQFCNHRTWRWYVRNATITTSASLTGTVTYVSSTSTYTFAGFTMPSEGARYRVIIDGVHYSLHSVSGQTAIANFYNKPSADISDAVSCTLYRDAYQLPVDFRKLLCLYDVSHDRELSVAVDSQQHKGTISYYDTPSTPIVASIRNAGEKLLGLELILSPPPSSAFTYDVLYEAEPSQLSVDYYDTGTVTTNGTTAVVGSGTSWTDAMVGSVIRISADSTVPTSLEGRAPTGVSSTTGMYNPYIDYRLVTAVTDATNLTVDQTIQAYTGRGHTISDPVDVEETSMYTALLRATEAEYARLTQASDASAREIAASRALFLAMENDSRVSKASRGVPLYDRFSRTTVTTDSG